MIGIVLFVLFLGWIAWKFIQAQLEIDRAEKSGYRITWNGYVLDPKKKEPQERLWR